MKRLSINEINSDQLDELYRRIETLEHVAAGNKRHVQLIVPDLERAEAAIARVRAVIAEQRVRIADQEPADGYLPLGAPNALWIDAISNICHDLELALQPRKPAGRIPAHGGPSVAECRDADRRWPLEREGA